MYKPRFKGKHYEMGHRYGALLKKHHVDLTPLLAADKERLAMGKNAVLKLKRSFKAVAIFHKKCYTVHRKSSGKIVNRRCP